MGRKRIRSVSALAVAMAMRAGATPSSDEQTKLAELDAAIDGIILFTTPAEPPKVCKMVIGVWTPVEIGDGHYARWSPDGQRVAVLHGDLLYVMDADGSNRKDLAGGLVRNLNPIEFCPNNEEVLFTAYNYGFKAIRIADLAVRNVAAYHEYYGEPSVSADGKRMASRVTHDLYAVQLGVGDRKFAAGCSPGVSPDGARLMNNTGDHTRLQIRDWDGSNLFEVSSATCQPDNEWDNHHWSNHPDYIAVQGDTVKEIYVLRVSAREGTRVTWGGDFRYADLFVEGVLSISGTITEGSAPVANRIVEATKGAETISTQTNDEGEYVIIGILAGDYDISAPGYDLAPTDAVTVSGADVKGADFTAVAKDTDGDFLDDPWEYKYFGDLTSTDGSGDADGDGKSDAYEYDAGTNPQLAEGGGASNGDDKLCGAGGACVGLMVMLLASRALSRRRLQC